MELMRTLTMYKAESYSGDPELQIREDIEDILKIIFLIFQ